MEENVLDLGAPKAPARREGHETPAQGIPRLPMMLRTPGTTPEFEAAADAAPSLPKGFAPLDATAVPRVRPAAPAAPRAQGPPKLPTTTPPDTLPTPAAQPAPAAQTTPARARPASPASRVSSAPARSAPAASTPPAPPPPPAVPDAVEPPPRRQGRAVRPRKSAPRGKLKNMLGLDHLDDSALDPVAPAPDANVPTSAPAAPVPPVGAAPSVAPASPSASAPSAPSAAPIAPPAQRQAAAVARPAPQSPPAAARPAPAAPITPAAPPAPPAAAAPITPAAPPAPPAAAAPITPAAPAAPAAAVAKPAVPAAPVAPATPATPAATDAAEEYDPATLSRATADFLRNSPILGLQGRPVQRTSDVTQFMEPDAVAIATLGAELGRLGVPEAARSDLRVALVELAAQIDAGKPEWARLSVAVTGAMAHPELARRLVPVLLPWLERAA
jgi:hypothetical protein